MAELHVGLVPVQHPLPLLTQAIVDFSTANPRIDVHFQTGAVEELLEPLRDGKIELIVGFPGGDRRPRGVITEHLYYEVPELCCRSNHPLAQGAVSFADLESAEWVLGPPGAPCRSLVSKLFTANRAKRGPKVKIEVENIFVRRSLVRQSDPFVRFQSGPRKRRDQSKMPNALEVQMVAAAVAHGRDENPKPFADFTRIRGRPPQVLRAQNPTDL
jgi:DNA-binding transcriptional LysR family regulator